jgi:Rad3-related DNA helicase
MTSSLTFLNDYKPSDLGFGDEFPEYRTDPMSGREVQLEVIEFGSACESRFAAISAPTGIGKTLAAVSMAKVTGMRTVILTATKALQNQYLSLFGKYGMVEIKGRSNYQCGDYAHLDCRGGAAMGCRYCRGNGCGYERAKKKAVESQLVVANYAYWMTVNYQANGLERSG